MTLEQYKELLSRHDWYYYFSDDHGVWQRGEAESSQILNLARTGGVEFKQAYNEVHAKYFNTTSFVTKDRPYTPVFKI